GGSISTNAHLLIGPAGVVNLSGTTGGSLIGFIDNLGTIVDTSTANWNLSSGRVTNLPGSLIDLQSTGGFTGGNLANTHAGLVRKSGAGTVTISSTLANAFGTVEVDQGTLSFTGAVNDYSGTTLSAGNWKVLNGSTLSFPTGGSNIATMSSQAFVTLSGA